MCNERLICVNRCVTDVWYVTQVDVLCTECDGTPHAQIGWAIIADPNAQRMHGTRVSGVWRVKQTEEKIYIPVRSTALGGTHYQIGVSKINV